MFGHLLAIILALLAIDLAPGTLPHPWPYAFFPSLIFSAFIYTGLLFAIYLEKKYWKSPRLELWIHGQLIGFLLIFIYLVGFQRFFLKLPFIPHTFFAAFSLVLYFIGIGLYRSRKKIYFYLPFIIPFLTYLFFVELLSPFFGKKTFLIFLFAFALFLILFIPLLFKWLWNCTPLPESPLKKRLELFCQAQGFKHGGMKIWKALQGSATAAIIGLVPRYRYVLFTEPLLHAFPEDEIEAILAHEIGHNRYKHLLWYPFVILGMSPMCYFLNTFLKGFPIFLVFLADAGAIVLYFRSVFGFFSRKFEAEADMNSIRAGLSVWTMISALQRLAHIHHIPLDRSNWHHGSLEKRIKTLEKAASEPLFMCNFQKRLRLSLVAYIILLGISSYLILF